MATTKITQSGIDFYYDNLRNVGAALTGVFTNQNNKENGKYYYDEDATKSIMALDIDWCGAKPGMTEGANGITTTGELLGIIKDYADTKSANNHTHPITLVADSGTSSINLLANTTYKLTAGGKEYNFKTPADYVHPSYTTKSSGLYKITVDNKGHVSAATAVSKSDITSLGIPAQDTVYTHPTFTAKSSGLYKITVDANGHVTSATAVTVDDLRALLDDVYEPKSSTPTKQNLTNFSVSMNGWTYGGTASNPSVSGNTGGGTVTYKYKVSTAADSTYTSTKPSDAGTYTVQATVSETTNYYGATATTNFTITKANINPTVSMSGWTEGQTASNPSVSGNTGNGTVTYQYKVSTAADSTYTSTKPSTVGTYTVKASIAATTNYNAGTATANFTISAVQPQTTYYWYAGQTDPSAMTTISPIVTSYENGGGWYELGTTLPTSINQLVKGGTAGNIWYVAVPADANLVPGSSTDPDTSVTTGSTKVFNGVTYQIYIYEGVTGTRYSFELNR